MNEKRKRIEAELAVGEELVMYWNDAHEDVYSTPGTVYVFGRVWHEASREWVSCCVRVENIEKTVYVVARQAALDENGQTTGVAPTIAELVREVQEARREAGIRSIRMKPVKRKVGVFDGASSDERQVLKVRYAATEPALSTDCTKRRTFERLVGTETRSLEHLLIRRGLKGPSWIHLTKPMAVERRVTHCVYEVRVETLKNVRTMDVTTAAPPVCVMSLAVHTAYNEQRGTREVVAVAGRVNSELVIDAADGMAQSSEFVYVVSAEEKQGGERAVRTEGELLACVLAELESTDPDVLVGHQFVDSTLDMLLRRLDVHRLRQWSLLGRLRRSKMPRLQVGTGGTGESTYGERSVLAGRLLVDTHTACSELVPVAVQELTVEALAACLLGAEQTRVDTVGEAVRREARHVFEIQHKLNILGLTKHLTNVAGNMWSRTLTGARSNSVEYLLMHEFHAQRCLLPERETRQRKTYSGGLVLEPKRGYYESHVVVCDFNSLYPSLMQEYNVCFTTVQRTLDERGGWTAADVPCDGVPEGVLPRLMRDLVRSRRDVKRVLAGEQDAGRRRQLEAQQMSLKLLANSMYGCLGAGHSRFYALPLAELVARLGREALQKTVAVARDECALDVVYGDTDSIMVHVRGTVEQAVSAGQKLVGAVNGRYKVLEIEIDAVFSAFVLYQKKKYAALKLVEPAETSGRTQLELKGVESVRRDWCELARAVGTRTLAVLLSGKRCEQIVDDVRQLLCHEAQRIKEGSVPLDEYVLSKVLNKLPNDYASIEALPHACVAQRMQQRNERLVRGQRVQYVVCEGEAAVARRAYSTREVTESAGELRVDAAWYVQHQLVPYVVRLCEPFKEVGGRAAIGAYLGCAPAQTGRTVRAPAQTRHAMEASAASGGGEEQVAVESTYSRIDVLKHDGHAVYADSTPIVVQCERCGDATPVGGAEQAGLGRSSLACSACGAAYEASVLRAAYVARCRWLREAHGTRWLVCDDAGCQQRTKVACVGSTCPAYGCDGTMRREHTDDELRQQMASMRQTGGADERLSDSERAQLDELDKCIGDEMKECDLWTAAYNTAWMESAVNAVG